MIYLEIQGKPQGKGRPRLGKYSTYTPQKTRDYEDLVKYIYESKYNINLIPSEKPIKAKITACFKVPIKISQKKKKELIGQPYTHKPDTDNIAKIILDSLNGLVYKDDSQITELIVEKLYAEEEKLIVELEEK